MIAKASTTCTYSLDPITLSPGNSTKTLNYRNTSRACANPRPRLRTRVSFDTITTLCRFAFAPKAIPRLRLKPRTVTLYFSRLLKNSRCTNLNWPHLPVKKPEPMKPASDFLGYDLLPPTPRTHNSTGGGERDRTDDLMLAKHALSQLSYTPG